MTMRIAMWSGPRNLSTALMRAFERREDTEVLDEPMYAHYLAQTGLEHPGRAEILESQPQTWPKVQAWIAGVPPGGAPVWFHKQMAHHVLPEIMGWAWLSRFHHAFLVRDPAQVIVSYARRRPQLTLADLGFETQLELFVRATKIYGAPPPVIDAADLCKDPRGTLTGLCTALGLRFDPKMLTWPPGKRSTDGVWAKYWYDAVEASTGFAANERREIEVPAEYKSLVRDAEQLQRPLWEARLQPKSTASPT